MASNEFLLLRGFGALIAVLAIPMALRLVPMNAVYGARFPESFTSKANWYAINAYCGRALFMYGIALIGSSYLLPAAIISWSSGVHVLLLLIAVAGLLVVVQLCRRTAKRASAVA